MNREMVRTKDFKFKTLEKKILLMRNLKLKALTTDGRAPVSIGL